VSLQSELSNCYSLLLDQSLSQVLGNNQGDNSDRNFSRLKSEAYERLKNAQTLEKKLLNQIIETPVINPILLETEYYSPFGNSSHIGGINESEFRKLSDRDLMAEPA
jgi:hypothetical protein